MEWVKEYYTGFFDKSNNLSALTQVHPDAFSLIETQIINRLKL